jgi:preprotein translocase subunit SecA
VFKRATNDIPLRPDKGAQATVRARRWANVVRERIPASWLDVLEKAREGVAEYTRGPDLVTQVAFHPWPERKDYVESSVDRIGAALVNRVQRLVSTRVKRFEDIVARVDRCGQALSGLSDSELRDAANQARFLLRRNGLRDDAVAQAFALIREAATRVLGMRHYPVQVIGGWVMLNGYVAEMETGEGKTLTATLAAGAAALAGVPVHVITVNDYLAGRDAAWMAPVYQALGLTVGSVTEGLPYDQRREAYRRDITYCTSKELVFDYLKDKLTLGNTASLTKLQIERLDKDQARVHKALLRGLGFAIVDEADSVLIDEARTPLIISGQAKGRDEERMINQALELAARLEPKRHYELDRRNRNVELTDKGKAYARSIAEPLGGFWAATVRREELLTLALSAQHLFVKDEHYLVVDDKIQIVDENTGRVMADRSWEKGLHQLVEAKENCSITVPREPLARISYQRFFRRYMHLAGMTGTAREVAGELAEVYRLKVVKVPTSRPVRRIQYADRVFDSGNEKWNHIVARVTALHREGRPVLVGTRSVAASEHASRLLTAAELPHQVLNARQNQQEAEIVARAGEPGCITIATNMAGRGTDIRLSSELVEKGGLHVILTERHESRRVDRQLAGRCGRQGDKGSVEPVLSLDDPLFLEHGGAILIGFGRLAKGRDSFLALRLRRMLLRLAQLKIERMHSRARRDLLKWDQKLGDTLAFSGRGE